jgi:hypothetical protein
MLGHNVTPTVTAYSARVSGSIARPANTTAYASGQLVANSTTAGSVTPIALRVARSDGGTGQIVRLAVSKTGTSLTNASFRVHLYGASPTVTAGDGGTLNSNQAGSYIGYVDVVLDRAFSDGSFGIATPSVGPVMVFSTATNSRNVYALIEARAAYTPVSGETFTVTVETVRD